MLEVLTIRLALAGERSALEALLRRASMENPEDREFLLANPDLIDLPASQIEAGQVFVAERGGGIVGFAAILPRDDGDVELDGLFVEPGLWRGGVGRALVEHCVARAGAQGAAALRVIGNVHAADFYTACGFDVLEATSALEETHFRPALLMSRTL